MATALLRAYLADPPPPPVVSNVYRAPRFIRAMEEQQRLAAATTEAEASQAKEEDEIAILSYQTGLPKTH